MTLPDPERETVIEAVCSAHRERDPHGALRFHPAWYDLDEAGRLAAADSAAELRRVEAALDPEGLSATARRVLSFIEGER
jgi:hypothetical protein